MSGIRIVLANRSLAGYPEGGGHWTVFLQYLLGLIDLGHDVYWLELLGPGGEGDRTRCLIDRFFERMREYGLNDRCILLLQPRNSEPFTLDSAEAFGRSQGEAREIIRSADLLWNFCCALRQPFLSSFRRRVLIDLDPGVLQVSALDWDLGLRDHDVLLSIGRKLNDPDCEAPTLGLKWHLFTPFVYLPMWQVVPDPGHQAPFSSITQWNWGELWLEGRTLSASKREAYLRYIELPRQTKRPFELAANIDACDQMGDRDLLRQNGWALVSPHEIAASPALYQAYISRSRAEIACPKPIFRELKTGWFSDRSACYLASGRPVLAEDCGMSEYLPTGEGLVVFRNMSEAVAGVADIDANYSRHLCTARRLAEEYLDSRRCLNAMIACCDG